jgi:uncharacterized protein (TIGR00297 family)
VHTWLSPAGAAAAAAVGLAVAAGTGWRGFLVLAAFFVTSSLLTPGGGRRRPVQVLANGGVAALCAALTPWQPAFALAFAGALAAAASDTWSTEIGARSRTAPRLLTTLRPVASGTSGGITPLGSAGGVAGALMIAGVAAAVGIATTGEALVLALAGATGGLLDSLLGATVQARWRCPDCGAELEDRTHGCPSVPLSARGWPWMTNDAVNLAATCWGAVAALAPAILG